MVFIDAVAAIGLYILSIFQVAGLAIFVAPFYNLGMLWALIPVWIGWLFTEYFREGTHKGTSRAGLVTGGFTALWAGLNWMITTFRFLNSKVLVLGPEFWGFTFLSFAVLVFGLFIMIWGFRSKTVPFYINRIWFFVVIMFNPLYNRVMYISLVHFIATLALMPVFYWIVEAINMARFRTIEKNRIKQVGIAQQQSKQKEKTK
jgi:hypothetical protein